MTRDVAGRNIKLLRQKNHISQRKFAEMCGVTVGRISKIENHRSAVPSSLVYAVCDEFDVTPNELFGIKEKSPA